MQGFSWSYLWGDPGLLLLKGFYYTCLLTLLSGLIAVVLGFITGSLSWLRVPVVVSVVRVYVSVTRNTPFVVQLLFVYFSVPLLLPISWVRAMQDSLGLEFIIAVATLGVYQGAFFCEVVRSGLRSVSVGQLDGARALGLPLLYCLRKILLPQAVRNSLPALVNEAVSLAKNTSIVVAIGVAELTYQYRYLGNFDFRGVEALVLASVLYVLLSLSLSWTGMMLSRRFAARQVPVSR